VAVDRSATALREARAMAKRRGVTNVEWKRGDIERLPLGDASLDVAMLSQALHHAERPDRAVAEAARVVRPGGRVLVLELRRHDQLWTRERLGDRWPGFEDEALARLLRDAGLRDVKVEVGASLRGDPFTVLVASGRAPDRRQGRKDASQ
jgi:ArsR family transcriptional regulator